MVRMDCPDKLQRGVEEEGESRIPSAELNKKEIKNLQVSRPANLSVKIVV